MKKIIYTRPDGSLCVVHPAPQAQQLDESEDDFISRIKSKDVPLDASNIQVVEETVIPRDRTFRDAWKMDVSGVGFDMNKCREIHRNRIRVVRQEILERWDGEWMKAVATGNTAAATLAETKRQQLRDATSYPAIDSAQTPDELKLAIPPIIRDEISG